MLVKVLDKILEIYPEQVTSLVQYYLFFQAASTALEAHPGKSSVAYQANVAPKTNTLAISNDQGYTVGWVVVWRLKDNCRVKVMFDDWEGDVEVNPGEYWRKTIWQGQVDDPGRREIFEGLAWYLVPTVEGEQSAAKWRRESESKQDPFLSSSGEPGRASIEDNEDELIYRLAKAQAGEELKASHNSLVWKEIAQMIDWKYGFSESGLALLRKARRKLRKYNQEDPHNILKRVAECRANETNKTK